MSENIDYKVNVDTSGAVKNVNALTAANADLSEQLKIAKKNLSESIGESGVTSKKTQEAAFEVNNLTAQIKENNLAIKEQTNTTKVATQTQGFFEKTMRSVTGNSTAYERAMKSMGVSVGVSDGLTKAIMFSTIAYDQAVTAITGKKLAETVAEEANVVAKEENTVATVASTTATTASGTAITAAELATWAWNAALAVLLAPLTAMVAIVAAVATGVYFLVDALDTQEAAQARLNKTMEYSHMVHDRDIKQRKELMETLEHYDEQTIRIAKAKGVEGEALEKLEKQLKSNRIAQAMLNAENQEAIFLSARKAVLDAKASGKSEEEVKKLKTVYDNEYKLLEEYNSKVKKLSQEYRDISVNAEIDALEKTRKIRDKKPKEEKEDPGIKDMQNKLAKLKAIADSYDAEVELAGKGKNDKVLADTEEQANKLLDLKIQSNYLLYQADLDYWAKEADAREAKYKKEREDKQAIVDGTFEITKAGLDGLSGIVEAYAGKSKKSQAKAIKLQGGINVAQIGSNTASGIMNALGTSTNIYEGAAKAIAVGITGVAQTAISIKNTSKALSALGEGGAGGSGSDSGSGASALNVAPQIGFQNSPENQISKSITDANLNTRVTVLASDITDVQKDLAVNVVQNSF